MSNESSKKGFRQELGDGYLNLLDSVRHSFEQAAWGQETSGNLSADDFYRWAGAAEGAPELARAAGLGEGVQVRSAGIEVTPDHDWNALEAWIDGRAEAQAEPDRDIEHERNGLELGE